MVSKYDIVQFSKREGSWFFIDNENVVSKNDNTVVCSVDDMVAYLRKKLHCDFEVIYSCHPTLETTYRCKDCGTVIFAHEDEDYENNLCCPVCSDYKTKFEYWSGEEIKNDVKKQNTIDFLIQMQKEQKESYRRQQKRNGKCDWQIFKWRIKIPKRAIYFELQCDNLFRSKLKGLRLEVRIGEKDDFGYVIKKSFVIPLSVSYAVTLFRIKKHMKKKIL